MEGINQADDYRRLQELYAEMSDTQIEEMSGQMEDLTEIAQQVLRAEISKRGLGPRGLDPAEDPVEVARRALRAEIAEQGLDAQKQDAENQWDPYLEDHFPSGLDPSGYDLEPVWGASDASDARQLMSVLESAGFKAYLGPENLESVEDYRGSYEDGVEIKVMKFQAQFAIAVLRRFAARAPDPDPSDDVEYAVFCPSCNSRDVVFRGVDVEPGKEPGSDAKYNWTCEACGHQWKDDGIEKVA